MLHKLSFKTFLMAIVASFAMMLCLGAPAFAADSTTTSGTATSYNAYIAVDQSAISGPCIVAPSAVTNLHTTDTALTVLNQTKASTTTVNTESTAYGTYVTGMTSAYSTTYSFPDDNYLGYYNDYMFDTNMVSTNAADGILTEKEYTGVSGWMMQINGATSKTYTNASGTSTTLYYNADTTVQDLITAGALSSDNPNLVIRWYFSANMGQDMGLTGAYLPTANATQAADGTWSYNWATATEVAPTFTMASKDALIKRMAQVGTSNTGYETAMNILKKVNATTTEVADALTGLN